jgi:hypothetical protein
MSPARPIRRRGRTAPAVSPATVPPAKAPVAPAAATDGITSYRWVWYFLSFFVPFAGLLIALFLYDQESWEVRKIGRNCLLIAFVLWILFPILVFMMILLVLAVAMASSVSDAVSPTD